MPLADGESTLFPEAVGIGNVTFCAAPEISVVVLDAATGGCIQPLGENYTCGCLPDMNVIALDVTYFNETTSELAAGTLVMCGAEPPIDRPLLSPTEKAVASAAVAVGAAAGGPAAPLIQGASMMMLMGCAPNGTEPDKSAVVPFTIGESRLQYWLAMVALTAGSFGAHLLLLGVLVAVMIVQGRRADKEAPIGELVLQAVNKARFPSLSVKAFFFSYQGLSYESLVLFLLVGMTALEIFCAVLGTLACAGFLAFVQYWGTLAGRDATLMEAAFVAYQLAYRDMGRVVRALLPPGFWRGSHSFIRRFGALYDTFSQRHIKWVSAIHLIRATIVSVAGLVQPETEQGCAALHVVLAVIFILFAMLFAVLRPHRVPLNDLVCVVLNLLTALLSLAVGLGWTVIRADRLYLGIVIIALISVALSVAMGVAERLRWRRVEENLLVEAEEALAAKEAAANGSGCDASGQAESPRTGEPTIVYVRGADDDGVGCDPAAQSGGEV